MLQAAAEQFGSKPTEEIEYSKIWVKTAMSGSSSCSFLLLSVARATLEGHQRAIMGNMSVEQIYKDRKTFSEKVFDVASTDLINMGIQVISYTLKDIQDEVGYLKALGLARTAEVQKEARMGEAVARMQAGIEEAKAEEQRMEAKLLNETEIARAKRDFDCKKAQYDVEVNTAKAEAELAYELQVR